MTAQRLFQCVGSGLALLLATSALGAGKVSHAETTSITVTYRIFITEAGVPEKFEFVSIKPAVSPSVQEELKETVLKAARTWTFTPKKEHDQAVSGWIVSPFIMDLSDPIPVAGGT